MTLIRAAASLDYVHVPIAPTDEDGNLVDPTGDPVQFAFLARFASPGGSTTYVDGDWETSNSTPPIYYARVLVGPAGSYEPTAGTRMVMWVKISDNPEVPVLRSEEIQFL